MISTPYYPDLKNIHSLDPIFTREEPEAKLSCLAAQQENTLRRFLWDSPLQTNRQASASKARLARTAGAGTMALWQPRRSLRCTQPEPNTAPQVRNRPFKTPFGNGEIAAKQTLNGLAMSRTATIMGTNGVPTTLGPGTNCNSRKKPGY